MEQLKLIASCILLNITNLQKPDYISLLTLHSGISKRKAHLLLIQAVYDLENYGMQYVHALVNEDKVIVGIGAKFLRIFTTNWKCKTRLE